MALLKREEVLAARLRHEDVSVPEWGGDVRVHELSAAQRVELETVLEDPGLPADAKLASLVRATVGDELGPFDPPIDLADLRKKSAGAVHRLYRVALRLNALSKASAEERRGN
jgi:hypothetical protein